MIVLVRPRYTVETSVLRNSGRGLRSSLCEAEEEEVVVCYAVYTTRLQPQSEAVQPEEPVKSLSVGTLL